MSARPRLLIVALAASLAACACDRPAATATAHAPAAAATRVAYAIGGMHCGGCADAIVAEVGAVHGVSAVHCTFDSKCAVVELADPSAQPAAEHAITKMGYRITPCPVPATVPASPPQTAADASR
jgi:copper chaperone CopZ